MPVGFFIENVLNLKINMRTTWMDLEIIILSKISQTEKVENYRISHMWDINLKATNEQDKQRLMDKDYRLVVTRGRG